ncbi:cytochrome c oxidase subunit 8A, mitochondrial-like [Pelobates cultripes]|uniref:Cytochrome c oxidase subunit 8A, mitochondrial-like n=1 Tax=Pelobates cultripes TaxID=61616 RepID=A0AAD1TJC7_PELCU|nr:cytochrome c oxidase subunit 8A, mitochondrial-like [Pelobates cultripes]
MTKLGVKGQCPYKGKFVPKQQNVHPMPRTPLSIKYPLPQLLAEMSTALQKIFSIPTRSFQAMIQKRTTSIHSKPPKGKVGPMDTVIGLTVFAMGIFTPAGWILLHLPEQKSH